MSRWRRSLGLVCAGCVLAAGAWAQNVESGTGSRGDRAGIFDTIVVADQEEVDDVACVFCTVRIEGTVNGDVAVLFGTLDVAPGREVHGDVATLFSTLLLEDRVRVDGDVATLFGTTQIAPGATIRGDRQVFSSRLGREVVLGALLLAIGLVWLLVWGVRRLVVDR